MTTIRVPLELIEESPFQTRTDYGNMTEFETGIFEMRETLPDTSGLIHVPPARLLNAAGDVVDLSMIAEFPANDQGRDDFGAAIATYLQKAPGARVQLAAGHRRCRAFKALALRDAAFETFPVDLRALSDDAMADIAQQENAKRKDLSPIEEAQFYELVIAERGWTQAQIGARWGLTQSAVSNKLRLLKLPREIQSLIRQGAITERHGRALLRLVGIEDEDRYDIYLALLGNSYTGYCTVAELETRVDQRIEDYTYSLSDAEWSDDYTVDGEPMCHDACPSRVQVGREWRCNHFRCYHAKKKAWLYHEVGPAKARAFYETRGSDAGWQFRKTSLLGIPCVGCDRTARHFPKAAEWLVLTSAAIICPECAQRAGLEASPPSVVAEPAGQVSRQAPPRCGPAWVGNGGNGNGGHGNGHDPDRHAESEDDVAGAPAAYTVEHAQAALYTRRPATPAPASKIYITIQPGDGDFLSRYVDIEAQYVTGGRYVRRACELHQLGDVLADVMRDHFGEQAEVAYAYG